MAMRKEGFYWVQLQSGEWVVAEYLGTPDRNYIVISKHRWNVPGDASENGENEFQYIDEDMIQNPNI